MHVSIVFSEELDWVVMFHPEICPNSVVVSLDLDALKGEILEVRGLAEDSPRAKLVSPDILQSYWLPNRKASYVVRCSGKPSLKLSIEAPGTRKRMVMVSAPGHTTTIVIPSDLALQGFKEFEGGDKKKAATAWERLLVEDS